MHYMCTVLYIVAKPLMSLSLSIPNLIQMNLANLLYCTVQYRTCPLSNILASPGPTIAPDFGLANRPYRTALGRTGQAGGEISLKSQTPNLESPRTHGARQCVFGMSQSPQEASRLFASAHV